jgi:outer membrane protein assembly factor BamB
MALVGSGCTQLSDLAGRERHAEEEWPLPGGNLRNQRFIPTAGPSVESKPERRWSGEHGSGLPVIKSGLAFVTDNSPNRTAAYVAENGMVEWESDPAQYQAAPLATSPAADTEQLYSSYIAPEVIAEATKDGKRRWTAEPTRVSKSGAAAYSPVIDEERIYSIFRHPTSEKGEVLAVSRTEGSPVWSVPARIARPGWVAVADGTVIWKSVSSLQAVEAETGEGRWELAPPADTGLFSTSPSIRDGLVYAATTEGTVLAVSLESGEVKWKTSVEGGVHRGQNGSSLAIDTEQVYVATEAGVLHALDMSGGSEQWQSNLGETLPTQPAVAAATAYVGNRVGEVYAVDTDTGEPRWSIAADYVTFLPLVITDRMLYLPGNGLQAWH